MQWTHAVPPARTSAGGPARHGDERGAPLEPATRERMERGFRHDFSAVRVHSDLRAGDTAGALGARAFTIGSDVHFAPGAYAPGTAEGDKLIAHELAHVVQQGGRAPTSALPDRSGEPAAHAAAERVTAGARVRVSARTATGPQLQEDGAKPAEQKDEPADVLGGGLKTVAEQLSTNNTKFKTEVIEPLTDYGKRRWSALSTGVKGGVIGAGVGLYGLGTGLALGLPEGRKRLGEAGGFNFAAPLGLVPYVPLKIAHITPPTGAGGQDHLWKYRLGLDFDDLLKLAGERLKWQGLSLSFDLDWTYDERSGNLRLAGGTGKLGILPGLSVAGGTYKDLLQPPNLTATDTGFVESRQTLPELPKAAGVPDVRVMITFDAVAFARSGTIPGLASIFGPAPGKK